MDKLGAVCGRFQIFHLDHLRYVLAAKERCEHLIVGITSPDSCRACGKSRSESGKERIQSLYLL